MKLEKKMKLNIKYLFFIFFLFNLNLNTHAQTTRKDNFFAGIKSIDLVVDLSGAHQICQLRESDIRSAVGYTLSNSPLRRIDQDSIDTLRIGLIAVNDKTVGGKSLGCSVALSFELWRIANFRGSNKLVTVWSALFLQGATEDQIGASIKARVEKTTKDFIVKWAEQN
jgi:hypothetical protein